MKFKEAINIIKDSWSSHSEPRVIGFCDKIEKCIHKLHLWNKRRMKGSLKNVIARKEEFIQRMSMEDCEENFDEILKTKMDLENLLEEEEDYWRCRSREIWLKSEDRNTKWFHVKASQRRKRNHIDGILSKE